ncbi:MAG: hypothetical protein H0T76_25150 [Nannocystis sp.]|nr:hypothetical protein [Nannocystis sp.]MBA3549781.1 hypothetical protein [Nannocystis sp.]
MEVIFDTDMLKPVLSPTMKTALSVLGLIGRSLVEANKCMKERVAAEAGQPSTLDDVMKQSGLHIPGFEEALAQFMGGGDEARKVAAMVANTPDPVTLLNRFATSFGVGFGPATPPSPIVTPPPASAANAAPPASAVGPLAAFRTDFTREARDAARAAPPSSEPPGLPLFRPDFTREARDASNAATAQPATARPAAPTPQPAAPTPTLIRAAPSSLVAGVKLRLDALYCEKQAHEATVGEHITRLEARLAALEAEWLQHCDAQAYGEAPKAADVPPAEGPASAQVGDRVAIDEPASAPEAPKAAEDPAPVDEPAPQPANTPADAANEPEPLPTAATTEEVVQAFELIDAYVEQARAADEQQLARIAALEQDIGRMEGLVRRARAAQEVTAAHA